MFGMSGGDTAPALKMQEYVLDQMPQLVQFLVVKSLRDSVFLGGITTFMPRLVACSTIASLS